MVESKKSVYDSENPPFVDAVPAAVHTAVPTAVPAAVEVQEADLLQLNTNHDDEESASSSVPHAPSQHDSTHSNEFTIEEIPTLPTEQEELERKRRVGAGIFSGVVGLFLGGPFLAMIFGLGAAYATKKEGAVGDTARAVGDVALSAREKAIEIDEKHNVVGKTKVAAEEAFEKAKELDQNHHFLERTKVFVVYSWNSIVDFVRRNHVLERSVDGVGKSAEWVAAKVSGGSQAAPATPMATTQSN
jgi:hypothetical protein